MSYYIHQAHFVERATAEHSQSNHGIIIICLFELKDYEVNSVVLGY